ncbi:tandem-95 repeat protein [Sesbania bispinosa]|nr:tandem-95 repeat protein [Sesbania bispinosa]
MLHYTFVYEVHFYTHRHLGAAGRKKIAINGSATMHPGWNEGDAVGGGIYEYGSYSTVARLCSQGFRIQGSDLFRQTCLNVVNLESVCDLSIFIEVSNIGGTEDFNPPL